MKKKTVRIATIGQDKIKLLSLLVFLIVLMGLISQGNFYSRYNFQSMMLQMAELGIYAIALFVVVVPGGLNLSIVPVANLSIICGGSIMLGNVFGDVLVSQTSRVVVGFLVTFLIGIACGALNGYFVASLGLVPVLVTISTSAFFEGLSLLITKDGSIMGAPTIIKFLGRGNIGIFPYLAIITIVCYIIIGLFYNKTSFGELSRLHGANDVANKYSGNSNYKTLMISYVLSGFLSAIAGIMGYTRMAALRSDYGTSFFGSAMIVCLMGGAYVIKGGGKVGNVFIAVMCLQVISTGINLSGADAFTKNTIWGLMVIVFLISERKGVREWIGLSRVSQLFKKQ